MIGRLKSIIVRVLSILAVIVLITVVLFSVFTANQKISKSKANFKKGISTLNRAIILNIAIDDFDLRNLERTVDINDKNNAKTFAGIIEKRFEGSKDITKSYLSKVGDEFSFISYGTEYKPDANNFLVFQLPDGFIFGYNKNAENCKDINSKDCVGFIDVNGFKGPNELIECDDSSHYNYVTCAVSNTNIKDVYPVRFYAQDVKPGNAAGNAIFTGVNEDMQ